MNVFDYSFQSALARTFSGVCERSLNVFDRFMGYLGTEKTRNVGNSGNVVYDPKSLQNHVHVSKLKDQLQYTVILLFLKSSTIRPNALCVPARTFLGVHNRLCTFHVRFRPFKCRKLQKRSRTLRNGEGRWTV